MEVYTRLDYIACTYMTVITKLVSYSMVPLIKISLAQSGVPNTEKLGPWDSCRLQTDYIIPPYMV